VVIDGTFEDLPRPDVIIFPGGVGTERDQARDAAGMGRGLASAVVGGNRLGQTDLGDVRAD
jgi:hypothetical protein